MPDRLSIDLPPDLLPTLKALLPHGTMRLFIINIIQCAIAQSSSNPILLGEIAAGRKVKLTFEDQQSHE